MISAMICVALFAFGHLVRDGWPALGSTHLARGLGAMLCMAGACAVLPVGVGAPLVGLAVWVGFYFDRKHAEGQNARAPSDTDFLMLSGLTSVAPIALVAPFAVVAGCLKPLVWIAAWRVVPEGRWLSPTRTAAMVFGGLIGAMIVLTTWL